jgi:hypothetical protein
MMVLAKASDQPERLRFQATASVLVTDDGELIAGHGRILAATHLGLTDAPAIVRDRYSPAPSSATASISTSAASSTRPATTTIVMAGKWRPITRR